MLDEDKLGIGVTTPKAGLQVFNDKGSYYFFSD